MNRGLVVLCLAACGGSDSPPDEFSLGNPVGSDAQLARGTIELIKAGHNPNNRGVALGLIWFGTDRLESPPWADIMIDFIEPPADKTLTIVTKQFQDLLPGEATLEYSEDGTGQDDHRGWHATTGTMQMTGGGSTVEIVITNVAMEPNPVDVFGVGMGTFDLTAHIHTSEYDKD